MASAIGDREGRLVLQLVRGRLGTASDPAPGSADLVGLDWAEIVGRCEWHGITGLVHDTLRSLIPEKGAEAKSTLDRNMTMQAASNLLHLQALHAIDHRFRERGLPYVVLKGLPLAHRFGPAIHIRRCKDIDLLVAPADAVAARRVLEDLGFRSMLGLAPAEERLWLRRHPDHPMMRGDGAQVELHQTLMLRPRTTARTLSARLLASAQAVDLQGRSIPAAAGPALVPFLAAHGGKHRWYRLFWLVDIAALAIEDPDGWEGSWESARELGLEHWTQLAWQLCEQLLGVRAPLRIAGDFSDDSDLQEAARQAVRSATGSPDQSRREVDKLRWALLLARGPWLKAVCLFDYLFEPSPRNMARHALPAPFTLWHMVKRSPRRLYRLVRNLRDISPRGGPVGRR